MITLLRALLDVGALFVLSWSFIFGGIGALLSHARERPAREGLAYGVLLGPFGWAVVWSRSKAPPTAKTDALDDWSRL